MSDDDPTEAEVNATGGAVIRRALKAQASLAGSEWARKLHEIFPEVVLWLQFDDEALAEMIEGFGAGICSFDAEDTPTCPACRAGMVRRNSPKGAFWGCSRYPNCKGTRE